MPLLSRHVQSQESNEMISKHVLKTAGDYLLSVLKKESVIRYSRFYDGTDQTRQRLLEGMGIIEKDADWYCAEALIDDAVILFGHIGVVEQRLLDAKLADGHPDYEIVLTDDGRTFVAQGTAYEFPDIEMHL
jgi:hypothetical protein